MQTHHHTAHITSYTIMTTSSPTTHNLNSEEVSYLSLLLSIIASQNWQAFAHSILHDPAVFRSFCSNLHKSSDLNGMTILHAAVRHNPPKTIIKLLLKFTPDAPSCVDCLGRTPLHIASGTRAEITTIQLLSSHYPSACIVQDEDGKTPLHLACDSTCELFEGDAATQERSPPSLDVIKTLISSYPTSVLLEDQDDMSALEHAIFSNAPIKVVKVLQYATRKMSQKNKTTKRQRRVSQDDSMVVDNDYVEPQPMMIDNDDEAEVATASHAIPAFKDEFDMSSSRLCLDRPSRRRRRGGIVMEPSAMARSA